MVVVETSTTANDIAMRAYAAESQLVLPMQSRIITLTEEIIPSFTEEQDSIMFSLQYGTDLDSNNNQYKVHYLSQPSCQLPEVFEFYSDSSLMMRTLHASFNQHIPYSLNPDTVWYCIAHELAIHINQESDRYRGYFTVSQEKEPLFVHDDNLIYGADSDQWARSLPLIQDPMQTKVPRATIDLFMPHFTTSSEDTRAALLVLFLNILTNYYDIRWMSLCGIPAIRIEGHATDWRTIGEHAELASREFVGLHDYFADLIPVLKEIADVVAGAEPDPDFWCSIYKYKNQSGGGVINGWITTLLAYHQKKDGSFILRDNFDWRTNAKNDEHFGPASLLANRLPSHISKVPFKWQYLSQIFDMVFVSGFMGVGFDGFLSPKLGYGVLEARKIK